MDLRQALIEENVATPEQVDEAVARQVLYGGDLITNLLDRQVIEEGRALRALCRAYTLPTAPVGELPMSSPEAAICLPPGQAQRFGIYPLRIDGPVLTVAASEPPSRSTLFNLRAAHNIQLEVLLALDPRVKQALARDANSTLEPRAFKALLRLDLKAPNASSRPPNPMLDAPSFSSLPQAPSITPMPFPTAWGDVDTPTEAQFAAETAPGPRVAPPPVNPRPATQPRVPSYTGNSTPAATSTSPSSTSVQRAASSQPAAGRPPTQSLFPKPGSLATLAGAASANRQRRRGPYPASEAQQDLQAAKSAEEMLQIYFDFSAQYFDYCVAFTLHGSSAALRHDRGIPRRSESAGIPLPLTRYPALVTTTEEKYRLLDLRDNDGSLGELIGLTGPARAFAAYVRVRARTVIALVGGVHGGNVDLSELGEVLALGPLLSQALELAIVRRKSGDSDTPMTPGLGFAARPAPVNPRARGPVLHEGKRAELLVRALGASLPPNESGRDSVTGRKREQ